LVPGSGGAGQHRGGLGIIRDYEHLSERSVIGGYVQQTRPDTAPWGLAGGGPGGKAAMQINPGKPNEKRLKSKVIGEVLRKGDVLRLVGAGGGGYGDPKKRDPGLAQHDRDEGFV
jgi:N-methylhydantoinase B